MKIYIHTPKAIKAGHPGDRVFLYPTGCKYAWKLHVTAAGMIHPAFKALLPVTPEGFKKANLTLSRNGSEPTAFFRPDSFYKEVSIADVSLMCKKLGGKHTEMLLAQDKVKSIEKDIVRQQANLIVAIKKLSELRRKIK